MTIRTIQNGNEVLAKLIPSEDWAEGLSFFSQDSDFIQVGTWNYNSGKQLLAHVHNEVKREVVRTQEVLYIRKGKIKANIFDLQGSFVEELTASEGDVLILLNSGHGYEILEDGTMVLEVKNGPYLGAEVDRRRL